ncbi:MAG TPA: DUF6069 family protein [Marmoricola sp.]
MIDIEQRAEARRRTESAYLWLVVGVELVALVLWVVYDLAGIGLTVRAGAAVRTVDVAGVVVTATLVATSAVGLRWLLHRREQGLRVWSRVAGAVWALSFLGPLGATTTQAGWALASFHLAVGGAIFFGVRRIDGLT